MNGMNRVILIGHIGSDPEVRSTASGKRVVRLSIATNNARKVDGSWVDSTDWHRVVAFDRTADFLGRFARKGDLLAVVDRREAIERAVGDAQPGDLVLVAGKGHESTQTIGASVLPFDDRVVARELLEAMS